MNMARMTTMNMARFTIRMVVPTAVEAQVRADLADVVVDVVNESDVDMGDVDAAKTMDLNQKVNIYQMKSLILFPNDIRQCLPKDAIQWKLKQIMSTYH
jgi:hypothetical protein